MNGEPLTQRKTWLRYFPEASLEFLIITRVLTLVLMLSLAVLTAKARMAILVALGAMIWCDYLLAGWWVVQVSLDLQGVFGSPPAAPDELRARRLRTSLIAALPVSLALLILVPWPALVVQSESLRLALYRFGFPLLGIAYIVTVIRARRALRAAGIGPDFWLVPALIPVVHWFALHRIARHLSLRIARHTGQPGADDPEPAAALLIADATWVLAILPWLAVLVFAMLREDGGVPRVLPICGSALTTLFYVSELAGLEAIQRRFVALIRRA